MVLHDTYAALRDRFEIVTFHETSVKTLAELDEKLAPIVEKSWKGRALPFPILMDATGETVRTFAVSAYPTAVLVDPDGRVVPGNPEEVLKARLEEMAKALPPPPADRPEEGTPETPPTEPAPVPPEKPAPEPPEKPAEEPGR